MITHTHIHTYKKRENVHKSVSCLCKYISKKKQKETKKSVCKSFDYITLSTWFCICVKNAFTAVFFCFAFHFHIFMNRMRFTLILLFSKAIEKKSTNKNAFEHYGIIMISTVLFLKYLALNVTKCTCENDSVNWFNDLLYSLAHFLSPKRSSLLYARFALLL